MLTNRSRSTRYARFVFDFYQKSLATVQPSRTEAVDIDGGIQMGKEREREITTDGG